MQLYNADLYDLWVDVTRGKVEKPSGVIKSDFGARYVMSDLRHGSFIDQAANDPNMKEVFRDDSAVLFRVIE